MVSILYFRLYRMTHTYESCRWLKSWWRIVFFSVVIFILGIVTKALYDKRHEGKWLRLNYFRWCLVTSGFTSSSLCQFGTMSNSVFQSTMNQNEFKTTYVFLLMNLINLSNESPIKTPHINSTWMPYKTQIKCYDKNWKSIINMEDVKQCKTYWLVIIQQYRWNRGYPGPENPGARTCYNV